MNRFINGYLEREGWTGMAGQLVAMSEATTAEDCPEQAEDARIKLACLLAQCAEAAREYGRLTGE